MDTRNLSATVRRKTSIADSRSSATAAGVLGTALMLTLVVVVVVSDIPKVKEDVMKRFPSSSRHREECCT